MFKTNTRSKITPLHQAIIDDNPRLVAELKNSQWCSQIDMNGFTPLELARLLGKRQAQELLLKTNPTTIKVQLKDEETIKNYSIPEFEKLFQITYRPFLTFPSYQTLKEVIRNCPYLMRFEWLIFSKDEAEIPYQTQLSTGSTADTFIKWINPTLRYGLFAADDLPEKSFVGEYTGMVRRVDRKHPNLNAYCFHYPTRFWSFKYFVIDSLNEGNILRFVNHSSKPNLQPLWIVNRGLLHLIFITKCYISQGTELTFDYGADYWIHRKEFIDDRK